MTDLNKLARGLTEAQRRTLNMWPADGWFAASTILGLRIAGNIASILADKGCFDRRSDPEIWGRSQYRLTPLGLALKQHIERTERDGQ